MTLGSVQFVRPSNIMNIGSHKFSWKEYGKLTRLCGSRDRAALALYRFEHDAPPGASLWGWITRGLQEGWLWDNQPPAKTLEEWCKTKFPKKAPKRAGHEVAKQVRELADQLEGKR